MGNFKTFDFEAQCHSVFQNVKTILEESGSFMGEISRYYRFSSGYEKRFQKI